MKVDILLKNGQVLWETPRNLAIIVDAVAALAGVLGYNWPATAADDHRASAAAAAHSAIDQQVSIADICSRQRGWG